MSGSSGVEKIKDRILADSSALCKKIIDEAETEAQNIIASAEKEALQKVTIMIEKAKEEAVQIQKSLEAVSDLEQRKKALKARQQSLDKAFNLSLARIAALPDDKYAAFIEDILVRAIREEKGEIILNQKDKKRLGSAFVSKINKKLSKSGKKADIVLSEGDLDSIGGFVLKYGDMEVNCTLETIMNMARPALESQAAAILFN